MATATAIIHAFVTLETAHAHAHGDAYDVAKAEIEALQELLKSTKASLELCKELAVDQGYGFMREQQTPEHVVRAHTKHYFTWHKR
jgi:hypothetical protein